MKNKYTVIIRCLCGCGNYYQYLTEAHTPDLAIKETKKSYEGEHRKIEIAMVLKGHCEEA